MQGKGSSVIDTSEQVALHEFCRVKSPVSERPKPNIGGPSTRWIPQEFQLADRPMITSIHLELQQLQEQSTMGSSLLFHTQPACSPSVDLRVSPKQYASFPRIYA